MRTLRSLLAAVMVVIMLASLSLSASAVYGEITYDDVDEMFNTTLSTINTTYIKFVDRIGVIPSTTNGSFMPELYVTRGEAIKIAYRMLHSDYNELEDYSSTNTGFDENGDQGDISDVSLLKPYLAWAIDYQLINSEYVTDSKFLPEQNITGEEFITLITKVVGISTDADNEMEYSMFQEAVLEGSEVDVSTTALNREQAAIIVARAMVYDPNGAISDDSFLEFKDFDGNQLNSLSTKIYGCTVTDLVVRATRENPLNYTVTKDVMLSNGAEFSTDEDFSSFLGYPIRVVYCDYDGSGTFTSDEKVLTYEMLSPMIGEFSASDLKILGHNYFSATSNTGFYVYPQASMYLNGEVWPNEPAYQLTTLSKGGKPSNAKVIPNRPNLKFTFIQNSMSNVDLVLAEEWIPGKVLAVTDNYISVRSYYDNKVLTYEDKDLVINKMVNIKPGDYVNFYESYGKLHLCEGTTIIANDYNINIEGNLAIKDVADKKSKAFPGHFYRALSTTPVEQMDGEVVVVLDITGTTYITVEEKIVTEDVPVEVLTVTPGAEAVRVIARDLVTGEEVLLDVDLDRIHNQSGTINPGDLYTYCMTQTGNLVINAIDRVDMTVIESEDYFIVGGEQKYLKAEDYTDDSIAPIVGTATLLIDQNNVVWAAYTK